MNCRRYCIGDFPLAIITPEPIHEPERLRIFAAQDAEPAVTFTFQCVPALGYPDGICVNRELMYDVFRANGKLTYVYHDRHGAIYAWSSYDADNRRGYVIYTEKERLSFTDGAVCFRHIHFPEIVTDLGGVVFHAALIETAYGGVLLSGASGAGKSTQAGLWELHRNALQINGDRPIVFKKEGRWQGAGSPFAGSSKCYVRRTTPVRAIAFVEQALSNQIVSLSPGQRYRHLFAGMVNQPWHRRYMDRIATLTQEMAEEIPCVLLQCRIDEEAVAVLERYLQTLEAV